MTVSPDITLEGGTSLNAKLAEIMPLEDYTDLFNELTGSIPGEQYTITATPANDWYALVDNQGTYHKGGKGESVSIDIVTASEYKEIAVFVMAAPEPIGDEFPEINAQMNIRITEG